jgi:hypothetical protein
VRSGQLSAFINDYATVQYFTQVSCLSNQHVSYACAHLLMLKQAASLVCPALYSNDSPAICTAASNLGIGSNDMFAHRFDRSCHCCSGFGCRSRRAILHCPRRQLAAASWCWAYPRTQRCCSRSVLHCCS